MNLASVAAALTKFLSAVNNNRAEAVVVVAALSQVGGLNLDSNQGLVLGVLVAVGLTVAQQLETKLSAPKVTPPATPPAA